MKKAIISVVILIAIIIGGILLLNNDCSGSACGAPAGQTEPLTSAKIDQEIASGGQLIDVRTTKEYSAEHAVGAINLALEDIKKGTMPNTAKDGVIYLYCRSGKRATEAKTLLEKAGFTRVTNIGGLSDWVKLGGQTIKT